MFSVKAHVSKANVKPLCGGRNQNSALAGRRTRHDPYDSLAVAVLGLAAFLLWLLNHPYQGIWHDARVYGLIAAHWIYPEALADDAFFRFGSQADLSLFTPLFGEMVRALGLDTAARWVVLSGAAGWVLAWVLLARAALGDSLAGRFAVLFAAVVVVSYSPNGEVFHLGENFATARVWALPCGLAAIACAWQGRWRLAYGLALLALLLHPLLGLWPALLIISRAIPMRLLPALALLPTVVTALIGFVGGVAVPGLGLFEGAMFEFLRAAPDIMFKPGVSRLAQHLLPLILLLVGARVGSAAWRSWYLRLFYLGAGALALAWVSLVFPIEIIVQGQPWRVTWLTLAIGGVALLDGLQALHRASPEPLAVPWLVAVLLALITLGAAASPWLWPLLGLLAVALSFLPARYVHAVAGVAGRWRFGAAAMAVVLWLIALPGLVTELEIAGARFLGTWWPGASVFHGLVAGGSWHMPLLLALVLGLLGQRRAALLATTMLLFGLIGLTWAAWDWRSAPQRLKESRWLASGITPHPFSRYIQPGDTVAWPERETTVWFELHTASFVGEIQRTGSVFSKEKFVLLGEREQAMKNATDRRALCRDKTLDWVVSPMPGRGEMPVAVAQGWKLYACHAR